MQVRKQQLELDIEQQTGSKLGKENTKGPLRDTWSNSRGSSFPQPPGLILLRLDPSVMWACNINKSIVIIYGEPILASIFCLVIFSDINSLITTSVEQATLHFFLHKEGKFTPMSLLTETSF